jgi:hypothetical protein
MIWVAWRQHRKQAVIEAAVIATVAAFLLLTGFQMLHVFKSSGLAQCFATAGNDCHNLGGDFSNRYNGYQFLVPLFLVAPLLFGMFLGAPLIAREVENGTHRLAWTQSVSRKRWISMHVVFIVGFALAGSAALASLVTWWSRPLVTNSASRFSPGIFDLRGVVPIAYAVFAVMLGVAVGAVIKKTLPAVGVTLVAFAAVRAPITLFVRQHYLAAKTLLYPFATDGPRSKGIADWTISQNTVDRFGHIVSSGGGPSFEYLASRCPAVAAAGPFPTSGNIAVVPGMKGAPDVLAQCAQHLGLRTSIAYQPAYRFWTFQWIEFGIFIVLSIALAVFIIRRVRRLA